MPHSAVSDLGLHCVPVTLLGLSQLKWVNSFASLGLFGLGIGEKKEKKKEKKENKRTENKVLTKGWVCKMIESKGFMLFFFFF